MAERIVIDTNLIVRHIVGDHPQHAKAAAKLFAACDRGEATLRLLPAVLAECVFVLESFYKHPRTEIARVLKLFLTSPGIELSDEAIHLDALARYAGTRMHFVDCAVAATAAAEKIPVASFDNGFKKFPDVERYPLTHS